MLIRRGIFHMLYRVGLFSLTKTTLRSNIEVVKKMTKADQGGKATVILVGKNKKGMGGSLCILITLL